MAKNYNNSNEGVGGSVKHLNTVNFNDTILAYNTHIKEFEEIVRGVKSTANELLVHWQGKGKTAFEKDFNQVQLNLEDISDIMYDLRNALTDSHAEYIKNDLATSKSFES